MSPQFPVGANLDRLVKLLGADAGLFVVALHAFIEGYAETAADREGLPHSSPTLAYHGQDPQGRSGMFKRFAYKIWRLAAGRSSLAKKSPPVELLRRLEGAHQVTNAVRHAFASLDPAWVPDHTALFLQFCKWAAIPLGATEKVFREVVASWNQRESSHPHLAGLRQASLTPDRDPGAALASYSRAREELAASEALCRDLELRLEKSKQVGAEGSDDLERAWQQALQDRETKRQVVSDLAHVQTYRNYLLQFTLHTRTRRRYEESFRSLTPDQESAVGLLTVLPDGKITRLCGHGGTGKTAVLIETILRRKKPWALLTPSITASLAVQGMAKALGMDPEEAEARVMPWGRFIEDSLAAGGGLLPIDLYIDEAQDFPTDTALVLPKNSGTLVWAVDPLAEKSPPEQTVAPIDEIILSTTLRQTRPLAELTRLYSQSTGLSGRIPPPRAYREGPLPEWLETEVTDFFRVISEGLSFHTEWLGYEPNNMAVLDLSGIPLKNLPPGVLFPSLDETQSTDYPVVFLLLGKSCQATARDLHRAITRAMDHLVIVAARDQQGPAAALRSACLTLRA